MTYTLGVRAATRLFAIPAALVLFAAPFENEGRRDSCHACEQKLVSLRSRTNKLVAIGKFAEAATLFQIGYREALAQDDQSQAVHFLNGLGAAHFALFEYRSAIDALVRTRSLARKIGNRKYLTASTANLCNLYIQTGDLASAKSVAQEGLTLASDENLPYRAQLLGTLGLLAALSGDHTAAQGRFLDAINEAELHGSDRIRLEAWSHYAQELLHAHNLDAAEPAALNAYRIGNLDTVRELRPAYLTLARIYRARGNSRLALALAERGLAVPAHRGDRQLWRMYFLYERAMVRAANGNPAAAANDLRLALSDARNWREAIAPSDSLRSGAELWLKDVYDAYIDLTTTRKAITDAFLAVEEERSASLLQMLGDSASPTYSRHQLISPEYRENLGRLRALEIGRIANPNTPEKTRTAQVRQQLTEADSQTPAKFVTSSRKKSENVFSRNALAGIQRTIASDEAVVSIHLGTVKSYVWGVTNDCIEMHGLPPRAALVRLAVQFRQAVQESAPERDRIGAKLYTDLFGSLSETILRKRSWILSSDDELFEVPFEALVVDAAEEINGLPRGKERPVYLVERHQSYRIPSAFALSHAPAASALGPFLALGDGIYNTADQRRTPPNPSSYRNSIWAMFGFKPVRPPLELPRLVSSTNELKNCASAWHAGRDPVYLMGPDLSRASLINALNLKPAVIHIAAHVLDPNGEPDAALIDLGFGAGNSPETLTTKDVSTLHADGALVVLSGCGSAAGNSVRGAGVMGFTRAWLLAGARAVVGSRWPVPDDSGDLFRSFYAHLVARGNRRSGLSSALQQAQLDMLRSGHWRSDPRYWGAFYLLAKD